MRGLFPLGSNHLLEDLDLARSLIYVNWKPMMYDVLYIILQQKERKTKSFLSPLFLSGFNQETDQWESYIKRFIAKNYMIVQMLI